MIIGASVYPRNSPRANRTTELAKELARQGHDVRLYAVLSDYNYDAFEIENNIKVSDIGRVKFATHHKDGKLNNSILFKGISFFLHKLLEFPDIELMFKIPKIIKREKDIDLLITVAVPYPIHWGAALAKQRIKSFPKIWVADCGDPYMGNKFKKRYFYFKYIEKWFCRSANYIVIPIEEAKEAYYKEFLNKIVVIPQGFNNSKLKLSYCDPKNSIPTFAFAGTFYEKFRDPAKLLEYLTTVKRDFKFIIYTRSRNIVEPFIPKLKDKIEIRDYIPREELISTLSKMDFLLNFENGTTVQSPSKLIDYAITKRPILSITSDKFNVDDFENFLNGNYSAKVEIKNIEQYDIKNVAAKFLFLFQNHYK